MHVKTNLPGYFKDTESGTIINKNIEEFKALKAKIKKAKEQEALAKKVDKLENDIQDIKSLLLQLVNRDSSN